MTDNSSKNVESNEKQVFKSAEKSSQLGAENAAVDSKQVKNAQSRNRDMPSGSAGPSQRGTLEVELHDGTVVSRNNPLTEKQVLKKAKESAVDDTLHKDARARKHDNKANTHILKVLADDHSLSDETKKFVRNVQEMRENSKKKGLSTSALDETAGEMLSIEIRDLKLREAALEKYAKSPVFPNEVRFPLPDIKTFMPGSIPGFVSLRLGPEDDKEIQQNFKHQLEKHDQTKLSDFDREKIHDTAVCDVVLQKYQDTLTQHEIQAAKNLPALERAGYLSKAALIDGACLGATKEVLHKVIAENEFENQMSGLAVGIMLGKTIGVIATSSNLALRGIATVLQAGGIALAAEQITQISAKYADAFAKTAPAFWELSKDPNASNFEKTKYVVEEKLGPPIADTALFATGLAAGHALDRILGKISLKDSREHPLHVEATGKVAGAGKFWEVIDPVEGPPELVVKQTHKNSCVSAVGSMLSGLKIHQETLRAKLEAGWGREYLERNPQPQIPFSWLPDELGNDRWLHSKFNTDSVAKVETLLKTLKPPFGAMFAKFGNAQHVVVIDGLEPGPIMMKSKNGPMEMRNLVKVRDPDGTMYKMTVEQLQSVWNGETVHQF
ncbi:MAG: hypothetical protein DKT66_11755 [Candidatus Melainabacteria bacterium]|nr:MAG: hypothetical protein DKT66_11755 [Candidatus Melainabacteria bacterium]